MAETRKIVGLDLTRSFAMILAMSAHALTVTGARDFVMEVATPIFLAVRLATPLFIILLGVMFEIVYVKRLNRDGSHRVYQRLFERALLCWLLYALSNLPLLITGRIGIGNYILTAVLLGFSPFTDILRYYTVIFLIAPLLLMARVRFGAVTMMAVAASILLTHSYFVGIPAPDSNFAHGAALRLSDLIFGIGDGTAGPSVMHSIFFIATGMMLGKILRSDSSDGRESKLDVARLTGLLSFLAIGAILTIGIGPEIVTLRALATKELRNANHPFFFFNGAFWSCLLISAFSLVKYNGTGSFRLTMLGQRSLFTFAFGNAFFYSLLKRFNVGDVVGIFMAAVLVCAVIVFSAFYDAIVAPGADNSSNPVIAKAARLSSSVLNPVNAAIQKVASIMARLFLHRSLRQSA